MTKLFLVVGENDNVLNFMAAEYFLKNNPVTDIYLIYAEKTSTQSGTNDYAETLREIIRARHNNKNLSFHLIPLSDVALPSQIRADLRKELDKKSFVDTEAHLNYTGGTKTMGIHVYQFLREVFNTRISFSYLDEETFQIVSDNEDRITGDLREEISISLEEVLRIQGIERAVSEYKFSETEKKIEEKIEKVLQRGELERYYEELENFEAGNVASGTLLEVLEILPEDYRSSDGSFSIRNILVRNKLKFLKTGWMNLFLMKQIPGILSQNFLYRGMEVDSSPVYVWEAGGRQRYWDESVSYGETIPIRFLQLVEGKAVLLDTASSKEEAIIKALSLSLGAKKVNFVFPPVIMIVTALNRDEADETEIKVRKILNKTQGVYVLPVSCLDKIKDLVKDLK